eukprot:14858-Heterococcus_DN1.PRE.3
MGLGEPAIADTTCSTAAIAESTALHIPIASFTVAAPHRERGSPSTQSSSERQLSARCCCA